MAFRYEALLDGADAAQGVRCNSAARGSFRPWLRPVDSPTGGYSKKSVSYIKYLYIIRISASPPLALRVHRRQDYAPVWRMDFAPIKRQADCQAQPAWQSFRTGLRS